LISVNNYIGAKITRPKMINASQAEGNKQSILTDSLVGIETIKSLALEPGQKQAWEGAIAGHVVANLELGKLNAITSQISATLQQLMTVAVISLGCLLVFSGDLSAGVLIGVNMMAGKVTGPLVQLAGLAADIDRVKNAVKSLSGVMNSRGEMVRQGLVTDIFGGIEFKDVSFKYEDGPLALDKVSFKIQPRQRVGIVGQSGSGQSTLARHIQGLLKADEGTITIDDQDIRSLDLGHLRINVAAVSQDTSFFKATIRENILRPSPTAAMARVLWASKMVGLHDDIEKMLDGYETILDEGGLNLTEAIRQKIAIARALIRNPKILILDDAVAGFDMESELAFRDKMEDINRGRTLIVISNYVSKVASSDLILVMDKGKVVQTGNHEMLLAQEGLYKTLYQMERALVDPKLSTLKAEQVA
jgi:subfamily B ATP-binding cassette protein HlyB/CyaB